MPLTEEEIRERDQLKRNLLFHVPLAYQAGITTNWSATVLPDGSHAFRPRQRISAVQYQIAIEHLMPLRSLQALWALWTRLQQEDLEKRVALYSAVSFELWATYANAYFWRNHTHHQKLMTKFLQLEPHAPDKKDQLALLVNLKKSAKVTAQHLADNTPGKVGTWASAIPNTDSSLYTRIIEQEQNKVTRRYKGAQNCTAWNLENGFGDDSKEWEDKPAGEKSPEPEKVILVMDTSWVPKMPGEE